MWSSHYAPWKIDKFGVNFASKWVYEVCGPGRVYLGIMEQDAIQNREMKERFTAKFLMRLRRVLKSKLNDRNMIGAINT